METRARNEILETALMLIAEGISVIPLLPRSKKPALASWKEFQEHIADEATVREWFDNDRGLNLGIVCGAVSGYLVVLDFDDYSKADEWSKKYGLVIAGCPIVKTGREGSGYHVFARTTGPAACGKSEFFDIKAEGGYVVGPGSTHPSGRPYKLVRGDLAKIPVIDPELLGLEAPGGNGDGKPAGWQDELIEDVPEGKRHDAMVKLVGRRVGKGDSRAEVLLFARAVSEKWRVLLPEEEVLQIVDSVFKTDSRKHGAPGDTTAFVSGGAHEVLPYPLTTLEQLYTAPPPEYGIEGLLHKNTLNLIDSPPKGGKTLFCLELAAAVAQAGDFPFLGAFKVRWPPSSRVLIVDQENGATDLSSRLQGMGVPATWPISFLHFAGVQLDREESFERLLLTVRELQPVLVIFDSLIRLHGVKEGSSDEIAPVMGRLRQLVTMGYTVVAQHHQGWAAERSRGSTDIVAAVDFEYTLVKRGTEADPYLVLSTPNPRRAPIDPIRLKISAEGGPVRMLYLGADVVTKTDLDALVVRCLSEQGESTFDQITAWMKDEGIRACESVLRKATKGMVGSKIIAKTGEKNRKFYSSLVVPN